MSCKKIKLSDRLSPNITQPRTDVTTNEGNNREEDGISGNIRCKFYLERKRRNCRSYAVAGKEYCVEHCFAKGDSTNSADRKRIPCPLDQRHSCYEDNLAKHLKICNKAKEIQVVYYQKGINQGLSPGEIDDNYKVTIRTVPEEEVLQMVDIVKRLYKTHIGNIPEDILFHPVLKEAFENPKNGCNAQRHLAQQASIIGQMEKEQLLLDGTTFIEFGAGKGGLSHWVQLAIKDAVNTQFVLVDKSGHRYKMDNYHKGPNQGPQFERLRIDIENLNLDKCATLQHDRRVVGIGKHLCGQATDLMIRCLTTTLLPTDQHKRYVGGLVLALCCHHRCDWQSYVGHSFMTIECGLSARQFQLLCSLTSWATCAATAVQHNKEHFADDGSYNHIRYGSLTPEEREDIGIKCKLLIDYGRAKALEDCGYRATLKQYSDRNQTLENICLVAVRENTIH